jgi:hypothetical protein
MNGANLTNGLRTRANEFRMSCCTCNHQFCRKNRSDSKRSKRVDDLTRKNIGQGTKTTVVSEKRLKVEKTIFCAFEVDWSNDGKIGHLLPHFLAGAHCGW